jgi:hypothetical protein
MIRTIISGNKRHREPLFALAIGDGRGHHYRYENWATRMKREEAEGYRKNWPRNERSLYRINVYPKRGV